MGTVSAQFGISKLNYLVLARPQFFAEEPAVFSIDWLRGAIPVEKEHIGYQRRGERGREDPRP
jgi:hypothetical protein